MNRKILILFFTIFILSAPSITNAEKNSFGDFDEETQKIFNLMAQLDMQGHADHDFSTCSMQQLYFKEIEELFAEGMTSSEIIDMYVEEYGQVALRKPSTAGSGLVAWLSPIVIFILGVAIVTYGLKRLTKKSDAKNDSVEKVNKVSDVEAEILKKTFDEERRKYF